MVEWTTACLDWEERIVDGRSIIPAPLFPEEANNAVVDYFNELRIVDAFGGPTFGEAARPWMKEFTAAVFGAYDPQAGRRLIREFFLLISKKNGKALALDTPIPTPSGWTTMGEIEVGDLVFGVNGEPCRVVATSEVFADHKCYRLRFSNGESVIADAGHLWVTSALADAPGGGKGNGGDLRQRRKRVRTTQEIADTLLRPGDGARNHSIAMPSAIVGRDIDLLVAPYTLGAWLGDGHSAAARITCHEDDVEIRNGIEADGWPIRFVANNGSAASTYSLSEGYSRSRECLVVLLRKLGVLNDKHIPEAYFRASYAQRLALLQGLMDTDGTISKSGRVLSYCGKNERLVRGVSELLSTFGVKNTISSREVTCNGKPAGIAYFVQFMAFSDELPVFRLKRKAERMRQSGETNGRARSKTVQIVSAEEVPPVPVKCISVDAEDHQFLFGRSMLPTHNSTFAGGVMLTALLRNLRPSAEFLILAPTLEVANNAFHPIRDMVKADPDLLKILHVQDHLKMVTHKTTGATLKVVAADSDTVSGNKATGILVDELWLFGKRANAENMLREATGGLVSRPEGFVIYLSTQSDDPPAGVFKQKLDYFRGVRDGLIDDKRSLPIIYEFPPKMADKKAYLDPDNFYVTNPNLGASVDEEWIREKLAEAQRVGEESLRGFLAKHLNVEIGLALRADRWAGADLWEAAAEPSVTLDRLLECSDVVTIGIDGGGLDDLLSLYVLGRERAADKDVRFRRWFGWGYSWAFTDPVNHSGVLERRQSEAPKLKDFAAAGELTIFRRMGDDVEEMVDIIQRVYQSGLLAMIGLDPVGVGAIVDAINDAGIVSTTGGDMVVAVSQGYKLQGAVKTAERKLADGTLVPADQSILAWAVSNARNETRGNAMLITKQASGTAKIDPLMAMFNAVALMSTNPEPADVGDFEIITI